MPVRRTAKHPAASRRVAMTRRLRPRRIELFDEHALGRATWVTALVGAGGGLRWVMTQTYV